MPKVPWSEFVIDKPAGHLLDDDTPNLLSRHLTSLMNYLAKGVYAVTVSRDRGTAEIHCAFRQQADADLFAASVQAMASDNYPGWLSQRASATALAVQRPHRRAAATRK